MADLTARIKPKKSSTAGEVPQAADLEVSELAVNTADGKLFVKHTDNSIKEISGGIEVGASGQQGLLMDFDGGNGSTTFTESSGKITSWTLNAGVSQTSTQVKYGASSFLGSKGGAHYIKSNDLIGTDAAAELAIGTGDFTFEFWVYIPTGATTSFQSVFAFESVGGSDELIGCTIGKSAASGSVDDLIISVGTGSSTAGAPINQQNVELYSYDTWHHIAACRASGTLRAYVDGTEVASVADTTDIGSSMPGTLHWVIGRNLPNTGQDLDSFLDNLLFVPQAKYTTSFTPGQATLIEAPPADGQVLTWSGANNQWQPETPASPTLEGMPDTYSSVTGLLYNDKIVPEGSVSPTGSGQYDPRNSGLLLFSDIDAGNTNHNTYLATWQTGDAISFYDGADGSLIYSTTISGSITHSGGIIYFNLADYSGWGTVQATTSLVIQNDTRPTSNLAIGPADGQVLTWVDANSQWEPATPATPAFKDLSDISYDVTNGTAYGLDVPSGTVGYLSPNSNATYIYGGMRQNDNGNVALVGGTSSINRSTIQLQPGYIYFGSNPNTATSPSDYAIRITNGTGVMAYRVQPTLGSGTADLTIPAMGQVRNEYDAAGMRAILGIGEYADDAAAGTGGVASGAMYYNTTSSDYRLKS